MKKDLFVSIDGGKSYQEAEELRFYWSEDEASLNVTATYEGLIYDVTDNQGEVIGTQSATVDEIVNSILGGE